MGSTHLPQQWHFLSQMLQFRYIQELYYLVQSWSVMLRSWLLKYLSKQGWGGQSSFIVAIVSFLILIHFKKHYTKLSFPTVSQWQTVLMLRAVSTRLEELGTTQTSFKIKYQNSKTGKPSWTNDTTWEVLPHSCWISLSLSIFYTTYC